MKKHLGEKVLYNIYSIVYPLIIFLTIKLFIDQSKIGKISLLFVLSLIVLFLATLIASILFFKPYISNFLKPKSERYEYKKFVAVNMMNSCIISKLTCIPVLIYVSTIIIALSELMMGLGLMATFVMLPLGPLITLYSMKIGTALLVAIVFYFSFWTSVYGMNALVFMMWNKQIKVIWGLLGIVILMLPVSDLLFSIILRVRLRNDDTPDVSGSLLISALFFIAVVLFFTLQYFQH